MTAADRPTEPPVECVAVDRDERCLCPGGPASHRPSPPAPAAEDDAVEKAARVWHAEDATEPRAWDALSDDERGWYIATTRKSLAAAGVSALRAEVDRAERDWKQASEDADRWCARAEAAEAEVEWLRERVGEVEEDRDDWVQVAGERAGQRDEARRQVADLRAGIEALLRGAYIRGWDLTVRADDLRALSGSGEQPGPLKAGVMALTGLSSDEVDALGGVREDDRPAPAAPDSTGLRERVAAAVDGVAVDHPAWGTAHTATRPFTDQGESNYRQFVEDITAAVLAVVGQGVTAEQAWDEGFADGKRHAFEGDDGPRFVNPYRAAVRSGEQGGDDRG